MIIVSPTQDIMAKQTRSSPEKPVTTTGSKFEILPLLKTEPIYMEDDIKPAIYSPCLVSNIITASGAEDNIILFTCDGCGKSGRGRLDSGYRLVKTAMLAEVGAQTGVPEIQERESSTTLGSKVGCLDDEMAVDSVKFESLGPFYYDSVPGVSAVPPMGDVSLDIGELGKEHSSDCFV